MVGVWDLGAERKAEGPIVVQIVSDPQAPGLVPRVEASYVTRWCRAHPPQPPIGVDPWPALRRVAKAAVPSAAVARGSTPKCGVVEIEARLRGLGGIEVARRAGALVEATLAARVRAISGRVHHTPCMCEVAPADALDLPRALKTHAKATVLAPAHHRATQPVELPPRLALQAFDAHVHVIDCLDRPALRRATQADVVLLERVHLGREVCQVAQHLERHVALPQQVATLASHPLVRARDRDGLVRREHAPALDACERAIEIGTLHEAMQHHALSRREARDRQFSLFEIGRPEEAWLPDGTAIDLGEPLHRVTTLLTDKADDAAEAAPELGRRRSESDEHHLRAGFQHAREAPSSEPLQLRRVDGQPPWLVLRRRELAEELLGSGALEGLALDGALDGSSPLSSLPFAHYVGCCSATLRSTSSTSWLSILTALERGQHERLRHGASARREGDFRASD